MNWFYILWADAQGAEMSELNFQEGLVVENRDHAIYFEINFKSEDLEAIKEAIAGLLARQRS